jgi:predicted hydrolase (HD superfamily)
MIWTSNDALDFLVLKSRNNKNIKNVDKYIEHAKFISKVVHNVTTDINNNSSIKLDLIEMEIAGMLHDIGYCVSDDRLHHPIIGANYLIEVGLPRISKIIKTHNFIKEIVEETGYMNPTELDVKTWNEAIITYASMISGNGKTISFNEKLEIQRKKRNDFFNTISSKGFNRVKSLCEDVESLRYGNNKIADKYVVL